MLAVVLSIIALAVVIYGPISVKGQLSAVQRWNPRRVPADAVFIGDQACAECHKKFVSSYGPTGMSIAMEPIAKSKVLSKNPRLTMQVGAYTYEIKRNGKQSFYSVTNGKETISLPIHYAFGEGKMGQTYVLQHEGKFYESLVSFYNETKGLDFTIGAPQLEPTSLNDAIGRVLTPNEVSNCFGCHATGAVVGHNCDWKSLRMACAARVVMDQAAGTLQRSKKESQAGQRFSIPGGWVAMS